MDSQTDCRADCEIMLRMSGETGVAFVSTALRKTRNPSAIKDTARNLFNSRFPVTRNLDAGFSSRWPAEKKIRVAGVERRDGNQNPHPSNIGLGGASRHKLGFHLAATLSVL